MTARLREASAMCSRVEALPLSHEARLTVVAGKVLPAGLYACPACPIARREMNRLRARIVHCVDKGAACHRSADLCFGACGVE
eukprot:4803991-Alexandrium_andersonii.AAC.1